MSNIEFVYGWTKDDLQLQGVHWGAADKETCVVCIHGTTGNIIENYYAHVLGRRLSEAGYGFLYGHNRGYCHMNDIKKKDGHHKRVGGIYENFSESIYDVQLWVNKAIELGYKDVVLMGHSFGTNKVIHYLSGASCDCVRALILASPFDPVGSSKLNDEHYEDMIKEAEENISNDSPERILSYIHDNWMEVSSSTYLEKAIDGCSSDNLPILRNPEKFEELSKISIPIFAFMGDYNECNIRSINDDLELIKEKAVGCPDFTIDILKNANHNYVGREEELADMIIDWLNKL